MEFEGSCKEVKRKIIRGRQLIYHALLQWIAVFSGNIGLFCRELGSLVAIEGSFAEIWGSLWMYGALLRWIGLFGENIGRNCGICGLF